MPGANFGLLSLIARQKLDFLELEVNGQIVSFDVNNLCPVSESIDVALRYLYSMDTFTDIERSTLMRLLKLAVTSVYCKVMATYSGKETV